MMISPLESRPSASFPDSFTTVTSPPDIWIQVSGSEESDDSEEDSMPGICPISDISPDSISGFCPISGICPISDISPDSMAI